MPNFDSKYLLEIGDVVKWIHGTDSIFGRELDDVGMVISVCFVKSKDCQCLEFGCQICRHARNYYNIMVMCNGEFLWYEAYQWDKIYLTAFSNEREDHLKNEI